MAAQTVEVGAALVREIASTACVSTEGVSTEGVSTEGVSIGAITVVNLMLLQL
ncbi:MAG: hypothetical protein ACR2N1_05180 [Rubripirellula sp.]